VGFRHPLTAQGLIAEECDDELPGNKEHDAKRAESKCGTRKLLDRGRYFRLNVLHIAAQVSRVTGSL
jgi:hypothetical protein